MHAAQELRVERHDHSRRRHPRPPRSGHDDAGEAQHKGGERNSAGRSPSRWCPARAPCSAAVRRAAVIRRTDLAVLVTVLHGGLPLAPNISRRQPAQGRAPQSPRHGPLSRRGSDPSRRGGGVNANPPSRRTRWTPARQPSPMTCGSTFPPPVRDPRDRRVPGLPHTPEIADPTGGWLSLRAREGLLDGRSAERWNHHSQAVSVALVLTSGSRLPSRFPDGGRLVSDRRDNQHYGFGGHPLLRRRTTRMHRGPDRPEGNPMPNSSTRA